MPSKLEIVGLQGLQELLADAPELVKDEMETGVTEVMLLLEMLVKQKTPTANGLLRESFSTEVKTSESGLMGVLATSLSYAIPVELGTKPHMPPTLPLIDWVKVKLGIDEDEGGEDIARSIAWKIAWHGTEGHHMVSGVWENPKVETAVIDIIERYVARIKDRLDGNNTHY